MATQPTPNNEPESNEELQEIAFAKRGCCFWIPCFGSDRSNTGGSIWSWERISAAEKEETRWWAKGWEAVKKAREWSELVAGPKWKTFIRRFNRNQSSRQAKFHYDPLSYSLNFDEGPNDLLDDDRVYRDFSSRYASIPVSTKSSMDLGHDGLSFTDLHVREMMVH